jgi:hypothetical protein
VSQFTYEKLCATHTRLSTMTSAEVSQIAASWKVQQRKTAIKIEHEEEAQNQVH